MKNDNYAGFEAIASNVDRYRTNKHVERWNFCKNHAGGIFRDMKNEGIITQLIICIGLFFV